MPGRHTNPQMITLRNRFRSELPVALVLSGLLVATVVLLEPPRVRPQTGSRSVSALGASRLARGALGDRVPRGRGPRRGCRSRLRRGTPSRCSSRSTWHSGPKGASSSGTMEALTAPHRLERALQKGGDRTRCLGRGSGAGLGEARLDPRRALLITAVVTALQLAALADQVRQHAPVPEQASALARRTGRPRTRSNP